MKAVLISILILLLLAIATFALLFTVSIIRLLILNIGEQKCYKCSRYDRETGYCWFKQICTDEYDNCDTFQRRTI